ncbi:MAG: hypothetical protein KJP06_09130 [Deltaproteobacteria bacterium]|nr:hypothetical protein [Deltaproteobacteria bacterium]
MKAFKLFQIQVFGKELEEADMRKYLIYNCAVWMICLLALGPVCASGLKTSELNLKMTEMSSLQQNLTGKITLAMAKKEQLAQKTAELKNEVKDQNEQLKFESYQKAVLNPRINYNLKLIQLLRGYITRLDEKIAYFQNGQDTLTFFFQRAQDDLLMIKTLNDLEIDKLIAQINEVLDEYIPEINKPMFDVNEVPLKNTEKIWQEIIRTN